MESAIYGQAWPRPHCPKPAHPQHPQLPRISTSRGAEPEGFRHRAGNNWGFIDTSLPEHVVLIFKSRSPAGFSSGRCKFKFEYWSHGTALQLTHQLKIWAHFFLNCVVHPCLIHPGHKHGEGGVRALPHLSHGCLQPSEHLTHVRGQ